MTVRTPDHPAANDKNPREGDLQYDISIPLENGDVLHILMGDESRELLRQALIQDYINNEVESILARD